MAEVKELSEKAKDVMDAIMSNPNSNAASIATLLSVSVATVTGSLGTLKKRGYVTVEDGVLIPTDEANFEFGAATPSAAKPTATDSGDDVVEAAAPVAAAADTSIEAGTETMIEAAADIVAVTETALADDADETIVPAMTADEADAEHQVEIAAEMHAEANHATEVAVVAVSKVVAATTSMNKAAKARAVFEEMKDMPRKAIMARLMSDEVGLSKNGANTYIYNMRKASGMVKSRTAPVVAGETAPADTEEVVAAAEPETEAVVAEATDPVVATEAAAEEAPEEIKAAE